MEKKENILNELQLISLAVATISNRNVYAVPANYFNALADEMLAGVQMACRPAMPVPYTVPVGYFDTLAAVVMKRVQEAEWTANQAALTLEPGQIVGQAPANGNKTTYSVPAGYFEALAERVMLKIHAADLIEKHTAVQEELEQIAPLLNTISKKSPYSVPYGYFENIAGSFVDNTANGSGFEPYGEVYEELEQLAPVLNSISRTAPYSLPDNYFQQFSVNVASQGPVAKIVRMHRPKTRWVTWLAAACITVILATGGFLLWQGNSKTSAAVNSAASLSDVSDEDINNYLNSMPAPGTETIPSSVLDENAPDVEPVIQNLSTEEIKDYLDSNSDPGENSAKDI